LPTCFSMLLLLSLVLLSLVLLVLLLRKTRWLQ
jgi:hypothetical protein